MRLKLLLLFIFLCSCTYSSKTAKEQYTINFNDCNYGDSRLNILKGKVVLLYSGNHAEQYKELKNESYPTQEDKQAISLWITKRNECNKTEYNLLLLQNKEVVDNLIDLLYRGKLTYGEFARYRENIAQLTLDIQRTEAILLNHCKNN